MSMHSPDTSPEMARRQIDRLRQMPTWRKMELMAEMCRSICRAGPWIETICSAWPPS